MARTVGRPNARGPTGPKTNPNRVGALFAARSHLTPMMNAPGADRHPEIQSPPYRMVRSLSDLEGQRRCDDRSPRPESAVWNRIPD